MKNTKISIMVAVFLLALGINPSFAEEFPSKPIKEYKIPKNRIYQKGWIDFNKNGKMDVYENPKADINARVEDLLSQMNLNEKTCQMVTLYGYGRVLKDDLPTPEWNDKIWKDGMGAIDEHLNGFVQWGRKPSTNPNVWPASRHAWALNEVQRFFVEETRLGIPTDFTNEGIRGVENYMATNFPTQLGIGHTWNRDLVRKVGEITGREARLLGYTNVYAPILDVGRDQRWGRYEEVYGESPYLVSQLGIEMVKGLQKDNQVASTAKHFAIYANNKGAREGMSRVDPQIAPKEMERIHLYPFAQVIKHTNIMGVMSSYNDYDGVPIQGSYYWLTEVLRNRLGFKGYVVSDSDAVEYLDFKHNTAKDMKDAVRQSVIAGLNVRCTFRSPDSYVNPLRELVKEGAISMETIDDRVRDILRVKFILGLFDNPYQKDLAAADKEVNSKENQKIALQASLESIVLLKNKNNTLPLNAANIKRIAVCGPNADEVSFALTHYGPLAVDVSTVYNALKQDLAGKCEVVYTKGCDIVDSRWPESEILKEDLTSEELKGINEAVENVNKSDVAVVVLGGGVRTCGENKSRTSLELPGKQEELLRAIHKTGKPVIVVLINGRPLSINWAAKNVDAIIEAWYPGSQGGKAISQVLLGKYNPGGKLTVTFPKTVGQIPYNFPFKPASQVGGGSKLGQTGNATSANGALYYFGYGLSYTTFKYSDLRIDKRFITENQSVNISCKVTNTGKYDGDEIVQLYVRDMVSSVTTYVKELKGFERVHIKAGDTKEVHFKVDAKDLALINEEMKWVVEPGQFRFMVAASSEDVKLQDIVTVVPFDEINKYQTANSTTEATSTMATANRNQDMAKNVLDNDNKSYWEGKEGDEITISLNNDKEAQQAILDFQTSNGNIELQLSSGGGQFLTQFKEAIKTNNHTSKTYKLEPSFASDFRVVVTKGNVRIAKIQLNTMK